MALAKKTLAGCGLVAGGFVFLSIFSAIFSPSEGDHGAQAVPEQSGKRVSTVVSLPQDLSVAPGQPSHPRAPETLLATKTSSVTQHESAEAEESDADKQAAPFAHQLPVYEPTPKAIAALIPTPSRKWTNPEGKTVLGVVSEFDSVNELTTLRTAAGETLTDFPLDRFSDPDRAYLRDAANGLLTGRVVGIHDGDSLTLLVAGNTQFKIRLEAIDAPELGQEYGNNAKQALGELVYDREITVHVTGLDKYQRILGFVWAAELLVNQTMIERGFAWHFLEYSDDEKLAKAELDARKAKSGLWRDYKPMSPWEWRDLQRANAAAKRAAELSAPQPFTSTPTSSTATKEKPAAGYWLNLSGGKRHNSGCRWYANTKRGRYCTKAEGSACGICGG